jgi:phenylpropionate dioxygenase-like ring-hydroxylating dioxygenase large terminal subunit
VREEENEMQTTTGLADDAEVVRRILDHIDRGTTDLGQEPWREPVANYRSEVRFAAERDGVLRRTPSAFCPSAALPEAGSFVARDAAGTPILVVRGNDGRVRAFRNACRHRGTELASGAGCQRAFVCRYHGWTYALDGRLRHVPHEHGFPGLDKDARGLVPLEAVEAQGLVFVTQGAALANFGLGELPELVDARFRLAASAELEIPSNWKVLVEGFLEGYHIRSTHPQSFYPLQYDNLNVVETFGPHRRVAFPYRAIEKQRSLPPAERRADGKLTYLYHLFPNTLVATFPGRIVIVVLDPLRVDLTRFLTWGFTDRDASEAGAQSFLKRGIDLVETGAREDREMACAIQRGLASDANEFFEFGLFESAIGHFHRTLQAALDAGR